MLAGRDLEERYCHLGKMDKCLEIRKRVHKATEEDHFKTETYDMKNKKSTKGQAYRKTERKDGNETNVWIGSGGDYGRACHGNPDGSEGGRKI